LGEVIHGEMVLNTYGKIIEYHWLKLPDHFRHIQLDVFQIMPDHIHGIIFILNDICVRAKHSDLIYPE